jgi:YidC/Oxa1 family membrane protein insertase
LVIMAQEKNTLLRVVVPVVLLLGAIGVAFAVFRTSGSSTQQSSAQTAQPAPTTPSGQPSDTVTAQQPAPQQASGISQPADTNAATTTDGAAKAAETAATNAAQPVAAGEVPTLRALIHPYPPGTTSLPLGSLEKDAPGAMQLEFSAGGAGVKSIRLRDYFESITKDTHTLVQSELTPPSGTIFSAMAPFAALNLHVISPAATGEKPRVQEIALYGYADGTVWLPTPFKPGEFTATIVDEANQPVLRLTRRWLVGDGSGMQGQGALKLEQQIENLSSTPLTVRWFQTGPIDMPHEAKGYGGDKRKVRFGYMLPANLEPTRSVVMAGEYDIPHQTLVGSRDKAGSLLMPLDHLLDPFNLDDYQKLLRQPPVWPNRTSIDEKHELVWLSMSNRYFGMMCFPAVDPAATGEAKTLSWIGAVNRIAVGEAKAESVALRLDSKPITIAAGKAADLSLAMYAGPLDTSEMNVDPLRKSMNAAGAVIYNFGGPCGPCTFSWLTHGLLGLLHVLHDYVFRDWSLAIVMLVVIVRTILHPVTKWSQIRMARFGKQMSAIAPKQKELQEKYKDDSKRLQAETARLWREEGISPTGMLGCIPMFLQMPVWIALYATLFFAVELRHQPAFYGVVQAILPQGTTFWRFLGDLSEPDRFIYFGKYFDIPLISGLLGPIHSINVLPLVLGVVFFIQQKYLTPPMATQMTPEQELQQKMMKWMMVVLFPLFMYNAPSGLAIYFIANSTLGILESKWIRHQMDSKGLLDLDKMKAERAAKRKPGQEGFLERMQRIAEDQQKNRTKSAYNQPKKK